MEAVPCPHILNGTGVFHLRKIDVPEIEDIALGAALLGAGGGGDP